MSKEFSLKDFRYLNIQRPQNPPTEWRGQQGANIQDTQGTDRAQQDKIIFKGMVKYKAGRNRQIQLSLTIGKYFTGNPKH